MASTKRKRLDIGPASAVDGQSEQKKPSAFSGPASTVNPINKRPFSANYHKILATRQTLPVYTFRSDFTQMLKTNQSMILVGETGSGQQMRTCTAQRHTTRHHTRRAWLSRRRRILLTRCCFLVCGLIP